MERYNKGYRAQNVTIEFQVGDSVMLYKPYTKKKSNQLIYKWRGPFKVIKRLGPLTYRIQNESNSYAAHVLRLKKIDENTPAVF